MQNISEMTMALSALSDSIAEGVEIPSEFKSFVDQHLPQELAKRAKYADRPELLALMRARGGIIQRQMGPQEGDIPKRDVLQNFRPTDNFGTGIPNAYKGPLDDHEPRLPPPATRWRT